MRIALITDGIWPYVIGGMQKHSFYLCKYLAQQKVNVDLIHFNASAYDISKLEFFSEEEKNYIHSIIVPFPKTVKFPGHYLYASYLHSKLIFEVIKDQLKLYDFIYTKGFTGWYLINQKYTKQITCAKIGVKFHGYEMFQKPPNFKTKLQHVFLLRKPVQDLSKKADVVFSYGGKITDIIKSIGVNPTKIYELPSGVEENVLNSEVTPTTAKLKFLFLGRYERRKGLEELNEAIKLFLEEEKNSSVEFHFIGPLPIALQLNFPNTFYHGEMRDKLNLTKAIRSCDVLICPSWSEGMPNVILEAMAAGLCVMATDVGANNVLVNSSTGWLMNSSNSLEIKQTLQAVSNLKPSDIDLKKHAALTLMREQFTWEKLILKFYNSFCLRA